MAIQSSVNSTSSNADADTVVGILNLYRMRLCLPHLLPRSCVRGFGSFLSSLSIVGRKEEETRVQLSPSPDRNVLSIQIGRRAGWGAAAVGACRHQFPATPNMTWDRDELREQISDKLNRNNCTLRFPLSEQRHFQFKDWLRRLGPPLFLIILAKKAAVVAWHYVKQTNSAFAVVFSLHRRRRCSGRSRSLRAVELVRFFVLFVTFHNYELPAFPGLRCSPFPYYPPNHPTRPFPPPPFAPSWRLNGKSKVHKTRLRTNGEAIKVCRSVRPP